MDSDQLVVLFFFIFISLLSLSCVVFYVVKRPSPCSVGQTVQFLLIDRFIRFVFFILAIGVVKFHKIFGPGVFRDIFCEIFSKKISRCSQI